MELDATFIFLAGVGIAAAVLLAVLAGTLTARLFYDASRRPVDDGAEAKHEMSR
jgi:4-amino-4-deoxy-L-arabinose transferase-like glycosyltransferase